MGSPPRSHRIGRVGAATRRRYYALDYVCGALREFTLPDHECSVPERCEICDVLRVTPNVSSQFWSPVSRVYPWRRCRPTAWVLVPEASMYEDRKSPVGEHDVRRARKFGNVDAVSKSARVQTLAHDHLRLRVGALHRAHPFRGGQCRRCICVATVVRHVLFEGLTIDPPREG